MRITLEFAPVTSGLVASRKGRGAVISPELQAHYDSLKETGKLYFSDLGSSETVKEAVALAGKLNGLAKIDGMRVSRKSWVNKQGFVNAIELRYLSRQG